MKNMKMFIKLMVSFLIITAFTVVVAGVGIYGTTSINGNYVYLINAPVVRQTYLRQMQTDFMTMRYRAANFVMNSGDPEFINSTLLPQYQGAFASFKENLSAYVLSNNNDKRRDAETLKSNNAKAANLSDLLEQYGRASESTLALALAGDAQAADSTLKDVIPLTSEINALLEEMIAPAVAFVDETAEDMGRYANYMMIAQIGLSVFCIAFALVFASYIAGSISKPLATIVGFLNKASATGDLSLREDDVKNIEIFSRAKDEIGELSNALAAFISRIHEVSGALVAVAGGDLTRDLSLLSEEDTMGTSMRHMLRNLNGMFGDINASTAQVSGASKQIADGAQALAQGSTEQAAAVEQLSNSISDIAEKTTVNADMADKTARLSETIMDSARRGSRQMDDMMAAVKEINDASQNISKVIKVINDIAVQTKLLALNAAVEAAHAGQHGKGFAVVAEEVGSLAAKSAEAAKDTESLIANSIDKAELGARIADETAASLADIVSGINEAGRMVGEIATASEQQSAGITEINKGIEQVVQVIQQNSATAQQSAAASEEMSGQASMLEELIAQFKLKDGDAVRVASAPAAMAQDKKRPARDETAYGAEDDGGLGKY